jgi:hypothetical protein
MGTISSRPKRENKSYCRSRKSFPLKRNKITPINKADSIFDEIKSFVEKDACTTQVVDLELTKNVEAREQSGGVTTSREDTMC